MLEIQGLARCDQYLNAGRISEYRIDKVGAVKHVFEIIEQQQQRFVLEVVEQLPLRLSFAIECQAERLGDGRHQQIAAREGLQGYEHRAVR